MSLPRATVLLAICMPIFCDLQHPDWKIANMTPRSPRVETLLRKLEPRCFGRFMIDLPANALPIAAIPPALQSRPVAHESWIVWSQQQWKGAKRRSDIR